MANARLGWFSPLGLAASIRASARWLAFGFTTSAFRHALIRSGRWAGSFFRLPLRRFRSASWPSGSLLPFFGMHRFGVAAGRVRSFAFRFGDSVRRVGLRVHCFRFSACTDSEWPLGEFVLPPSASEIALGGLVLPLGGWPSGSLLPLFGTHRFGVALVGLAFGSPLPLFGMHRSAPLHRRSEDRRSTPTRQLFHFKTLIPTC